MTLLTLFTAPKPFTNPHIAAIQRNALACWLAVGRDTGNSLEVCMIGDENGMAEEAARLGVAYQGAAQPGVAHLPQVKCTPLGTPLVSSIFDLARQHSRSPLLAYLNADMLLLPDFVAAAQYALAHYERFLMVGQRWDLDVREELDFGPGWAERLTADVAQRGRLHPPGGSDYFIYPRACFETVPPFAIGRAGWDNWMFYQGRAQGWPVVDASKGLMVIHQDHDYSHLPDGKPHYRLPETKENVRLAGGPRTMFVLFDADHTLIKCSGAFSIERIAPRGRKFWREVETFPVRRLKGGLRAALAELFYIIFNPKRAWGEWRGRWAYQFQVLKKRILRK